MKVKGFEAVSAELRLNWVAGLAVAMAALPMAAVQPTDGALKRETQSIRVTFDARQPGLSALSIDALKRGAFRPSPIVGHGPSSLEYTVSERDGWIRYALSSDPEHAVWEMQCEGDTLRMRSIFQPGQEPRDLTWKFDPDITHATLLGRVTPQGDIGLPAVLHLPGMGSLRIHLAGSGFGTLHYAAHRHPDLYVEVTFPAATAEHKLLEYTLQTAAIFPAVPGMKPDDRRFDGFRREWLDALQLNAELHMLSNNAASDPCAFVLYKYSDIARYTPELAEGLTALDIVRETLDRYLSGFSSYGMPGFKEFDGSTFTTDPRLPYVFLDVYPSLIISAWDYVDGSGDQRWLRENYKGLRTWADHMTRANADGSPLLEYPASGNSGSWGDPFTVRPSNWWDTIGFGHQDAYANALAFRALRSMAVLAERIGETADATRYRERAQQIHDVYPSSFIDPATGVVAGWRSSDGQLHNYFFPFVNGIAVRYGLIDGEQARQAMRQILAKMKNVGYKDFSLGLPGNLIPIRRADYVDQDPRYGGSRREDGSDGFQVYENGGATACFAYFTLGALYHLGEKKQADKILMPMLEAFERQGFSGRAPNGMTYDWKDWHGGAHGYEGFLVDNYYALLSVLDRANMLEKMP
jgi:hypothetical protein